MIPVQLKLKNFMSYGTAAPPLDFGQFGVACLSGRNGQGKSALLDAVTWALWGKARKASGNRKPDADLLRIGAQEMRVELIFDVEGDRYRVTRQYRDRGKTSTSGLELHALNPQSGEYQALTEGKMRQTQAAIDNVIGLSYDTFINSAFLLQGRSDEFTKKRPSQRKEILANVLNLERYEKLAERARAHRREAKTKQEQANRDVERLEEELEKEADWKAAYEELEAQVDEKKECLQSLRECEQKRARRLVELENKAEEADSLRAAKKQLNERVTEATGDAEALEEQIEEAEALEQQSDDIEAAYERFGALREERNTLETKGELHRSLQQQIQKKENERSNEQGKLANKIHRLQNDVEVQEERLEEIDEWLAGREEVQEKLETAREARDELQTLKETRAKRDELAEKQQGVKEAVASERDTLKGRLESLRENIENGSAQLPDRESLQDQKATLKRKQTERKELQEEASSVEEKGQALSETIREHVGNREALQQDREDVEAQFVAFRRNADDTCPTCGTELTPHHRREVVTHFENELEHLQTKIDEAKAGIAERKEKRAGLREQYKALQEKIDEYDDIGDALASVNEKLRSASEQRKALKEQEEAAEELQARIREKNFAQEERERWRALKEKKSAVSFDEERYEELQHTASQEERYAEQLRDIEHAAARKEPAQKKLEAMRDKLQTLRRQLDDDSAFEDLDARLEELREKREGVDFDRQRLQEVRSALGKLDGAAARREKLKNTRRNLSDWRGRVKRAREQAASAREDLEAKGKQLKNIKKALAQKENVEKKHEAIQKERKETEEVLNTLRTKKGRLEKTLEDAKKKRERLREHREQEQDAKAEHHLYSHLNDAFGKDGIPSLIIEETLPEIEERANDLLSRLTEGRMTVRLETLQEKKSGGTKETLEIIISDEQGVARPYETFSGGESFRVNFALRVALSQLLAERSGVRIRTLVIDEGFGTQDAEGVQNLVEAIQAVQDDFAKILVITHLSDLKEAFPVRIEVEKDPVAGSSFDLIGV